VLPRGEGGELRKNNSRPTDRADGESIVGPRRISKRTHSKVKWAQLEDDGALCKMSKSHHRSMRGVRMDGKINDNIKGTD